MSLVLTTPPALEPVTLIEVKQHLRVSHTQDDELIATMAKAARQVTETLCGCKWMTQGWELTRDVWPAELREVGICLPFGPVQTVSAITVVGDSGPITVPPSAYALAAASNRQLVFLATPPAPVQATGGITIDFAVGMDDPEDVPGPVRQAIALLTAHFYERREVVEPRSLRALPRSVDALLAPYREMSI